MPSYKSKYNQLLDQHLELVQHMNAALSNHAMAMERINQMSDMIDRQQVQIEKLQNAALKSLGNSLAAEATTSEPSSKKPKQK